jgi:hypothetical protein
MVLKQNILAVSDDMSWVMDEEDIKILLKKIDNKMETVEEDHPTPIGASHAKNKQDAYYSGVKSGLRIAQKCITGEY